MISHPNALEAFTVRRPTRQAWRKWLGGALLAAAAVAAVFARRKRDDVEPDPFATERPFLTDFWPRD